MHKIADRNLADDHVTDTTARIHSMRIHYRDYFGIFFPRYGDASSMMAEGVLQYS